MAAWPEIAAQKCPFFFAYIFGIRFELWDSVPSCYSSARTPVQYRTAFLRLCLPVSFPITSKLLFLFHMLTAGCRKAMTSCGPPCHSQYFQPCSSHPASMLLVNFSAWDEAEVSPLHPSSLTFSSQHQGFQVLR